MPDLLCICCYDLVTADDGDPLYLHPSDATVPDSQPTAWVHKDCLADYARPFEIGDLPETDLAALREYARSVDADWAKR
jgi:hypothetical protein